jgi:hypothetical protein
MTRVYRLVDAAAVAFGLLGLFVLLFGAFSVSLGSWAIRFTGADRLLFVAAAIAAVRHAAYPADPLHRRLLRFARVFEDSPGAVARTAIASRIAVLIVGYFAVLTIGIAAETSGFTVSADPVLNLPARFDAGWYGTIALEGYSFQGRFDRQQNVAFFPAFPLLQRLAGYPFGAFAANVSDERRLARVLWAGVAISIVAFAWAAVYFWRLARDMIGTAFAFDAVALLAAYPFAVYFSAAYSESLFLLASVATFYHFRRGELARASGWGLFTGLTRPNGCFLSVALAAQIVAETIRPADAGGGSAGRAEGPRLTHWLAAATPGIGMLLFSAYVKHLTGAWFGWARLHETWGRTFSGVTPLIQTYERVAGQGLLSALQAAPYDALNALAVLFALAMLWPVFRRAGIAGGVLVIVNILPPLLAGGVLSMGRVTSTTFPLFLALAAIVPPRMVTPLVTAFAVGQGLVAVVFFTWRPLF